MNPSDFKDYSAIAGLIFIAGFIVVRIEPALKCLSEAVSKLTGVIEKCQK